MLRRIARGFVHLIAGISAGVAIIAVLVAWQLNRGPVSLAFITPYIEKAVNAGHPDFSLKMGDTILTWGGWDRNLDIRVVDVELVDGGGRSIGKVPEVSFSLSGDALIKGKIAPRSVELFGPTFQIRRERDGTIDVGFGGQATKSRGLASRFLDRLFAQPSPDKPMTFLSLVTVVGGDITLIDQVLKKSWHMPAADVRLVREADGIRGQMSVVLAFAGQQTEFDIDGAYDVASRRLTLNLDVRGIAPATVASLLPEAALLDALEVPLSGSVSLQMPIDGVVEIVAVSLKGGAGRIVPPGPNSRPIPIDSIALRATYNGPEARTDIDYLEIDVGEAGNVYVPAPIDHAFPLTGLTLRGRYLAKLRRFELKSLDAVLDGPRVSLSGTVDAGAKNGAIIVNVAGELRDGPLARMKTFWPKTLGAKPYDWITNHLSNGIVDRAAVKGRFSIRPDGSHQIIALNGDMDVRGATVDYLPPMPVVTGVDAHMEFDDKTFNIFMKSGRSENLTVERGKFFITGLRDVDQFADVELLIKGDFADQLKYIDHQPLGFASALAISAEKAKGRATTELDLKFILEKDVTLDQVEVSGKARLDDISMASVFLGRGIDHGNLEIDVDKKGMTVKGDVMFDKIPADLVWRQNFGAKPEFRSQYDVRATIADIRRVEDLGLDMAPFSGNFIKGSVDAAIRFTVLDDIDRRLRVTADIAGASISAPVLGWAKNKGTPGKAEITLNLERDVVSDIPSFSVSTDDLTLKGAAKYALDGTGLEKIDFETIKFGRNDVSGALIPRSDGGWDFGLQGKSLDISTIWSDFQTEGATAADTDNPLLSRLTLAIELDRVWLDDVTSVSGVSGTFARQELRWRTVLLRSRVNDGADFDLQMQPGKDGNRTLLVTSNDAGAVLKLFDLYPNMVGGKLRIIGKYDDAQTEAPLTGEINVDDYRILNAPVLARVVSIMALTGILEALDGKGLAFNDLVIPFEMKQGTFKLHEARAAGTSLGFTASGSIYRNADVVDLEGTVVPAYALNSVFGYIPLLGDILTGGEKGGGVFAASFTMTGPREEPVVSVNPLSALTPGILRKVFGILGKAEVSPPMIGPGETPVSTE